MSNPKLPFHYEFDGGRPPADGSECTHRHWRFDVVQDVSGWFGISLVCCGCWMRLTVEGEDDAATFIAHAAIGDALTEYGSDYLKTGPTAAIARGGCE